jgi:hypothetical protein
MENSKNWQNPTETLVGSEITDLLGSEDSLDQSGSGFPSFNIFPNRFVCLNLPE